MAASERPIDRLIAIMARLRDPEHGCPWDREQDFRTIAPYTIEEAYEVADAIERGDLAALKDELGDLLLQVVFHARMAEEAGDFRFDDVVAAIAEKMVRRHPHVFGDAEIASVAAQNAAWEAHKAAEREAKGGHDSVLDGVALTLPALLRAVKISRRAARIGFDWPDIEGVFAKIAEEIDELRAEIDASAGRERIEDELGDLLYVVAMLARKLDVEPETALRRATAKFERRFRRLEVLARERGTGCDLDDLEALWAEVKAAERVVELQQVRDSLPVDFEVMRGEARAEGYRMLDRLADEWTAGVTRFDRPGEALLVARAGGTLAGIGGLTIDPIVPGALRMRRFYVRKLFRRRGIARRLVSAILAMPVASAHLVTVNAAASSEPFWEAFGFKPDRRDGHTHILTDRGLP